ncbi:GNAT family N-acetyltransferase [Acrocarpospora phusangensis]|uniref:GNAT family N-acetyltransferase n=1 Tax=Acrocarpospora phusangensis TaxID=1070424 RepID=UPI00194DE65A|nr:GNAT family N-acetyltransferase [Acrocarpospora phusangensis]
MRSIDIRPAVRAELPRICRTLGQRPYFVDRLNAQATGHGVLLVAWDRTEAVGDLYLWLAAAEEREIRAHLPGVPLITHLEVEADRRNRGVGTALMRHAERHLWLDGLKQVALGVGLHNEAARRLYVRLGYVEWPHGPIDTTEVLFRADGTREHRPETCRIMVKQLASE